MMIKIFVSIFLDRDNGFISLYKRMYIGARLDELDSHEFLYWMMFYRLNRVLGAFLYHKIDKINFIISDQFNLK